MRKFPLCLLLAVLAMALLPNCSSDKNKDLEEAYGSWLSINNAWLKEQLAKSEGENPYYTKLVPSWNPDGYVLIHYFNDRKETEGNLSPLYTSTIDTRYYATYCNGTPMDSSTNLTANGNGIFRTQLSSVITGWAIAFEDMRVGDTAQIVIPYQQAYGASTTSSVVPYSNLVFNVRLVDIVDYEQNPK